MIGISIVQERPFRGDQQFGLPNVGPQYDLIIDIDGAVAKITFKMAGYQEISNLVALFKNINSFICETNNAKKILLMHQAKKINDVLVYINEVENRELVDEILFPDDSFFYLTSLNNMLFKLMHHEFKRE